MERAVIVAVVIIAAVVLYNKVKRMIASKPRKGGKVIRRMSEENVAEILKLPSANDVCPCKTPRCAYKGREHPKTVRMYRHGKKP